VQVLIRTILWAKAVLPHRVEVDGVVLPNRTRKVRQAMRQLIVTDAGVGKAILTRCRITIDTWPAWQLQRFIQRVQQVINRAVRRVLAGEPVVVSQKLASIFELHTDIIYCGKPSRPAELGRVVRLDEAEAVASVGIRFCTANSANLG
jgi:hypothetical protein